MTNTSAKVLTPVSAGTQSQNPSKSWIVAFPNLGAASIALTLILLGSLSVHVFTGWLVQQYVHVLAPDIIDQKNHGVILQKAAFAQADLLPIYGSSELARMEPNHASLFFQDYPTGFTIFPVGNRGVPPLILIESLAAVGKDIRGKKVVISISPIWFTSQEVLRQDAYAGNYSPLQAAELVFSTDLSFDLKQTLAKRMLFYAPTVEKDPVLKLALEQLANDSLPGQIFYYALFPTGKLEIAVFQLQDDMQMLSYIFKHPPPQSLERARPTIFDWTALARQAEQDYQPQTTNNPFGIENDWWTMFQDYLVGLHNSTTDAQFLEDLQDAEGWTDLNLLLRELQELGAEPLILSMPINGPFYDYMGVSAQSRSAFYRKLQGVAASYQVPLVDFAEHDGDKYFSKDQTSHPSPMGWILVDQVLDAFYHGTLN